MPTDSPAASLSHARVLDAEGNPATLAAGDDEHACVRLPDGSELLVPLALLVAQADGSYRLPFSLRQPDGGAVVSLPLHEERLRVDKRSVDSGQGIRVHKTVEEREQLVDLPLAHDELQVERIAIGEVVSGEQLPQARQEGDTLIVPILEEQLVLHKQTVLKEELRITRRQVMRTQQQAIKLRSEVASVERFAQAPPQPEAE